MQEAEVLRGAILHLGVTREQAIKAQVGIPIQEDEVLHGAILTMEASTIQAASVAVAEVAEEALAVGPVILQEAPLADVTRNSKLF
jgi:hypothetical protein